jgi:hypothetical protein
LSAFAVATPHPQIYLRERSLSLNCEKISF